MTEVLYCPINNEFLLFDGSYKIDAKGKVMTLYVYARNDKIIKLSCPKTCIHIGWL